MADLSLFAHDTSGKLLTTAVAVAAVLAVRYVLGWVLDRAGHKEEGRRERARFWAEQGLSLATVLVLVGVVVSIWFGDAGRLASAAGLITAGIAVALQRVITSFAAYLIILRGRIYTVGDRITMGGVRGDVVDLGFMQTAVMEMGEAPGEQADAPSVWVKARQYTGRIVRVTNDKIFDAPVYNYTREFPFVWEELHVGIKYGADYRKAESILLDVGRRHTQEDVAEAAPALDALRRRYWLPEDVALEPRVYMHLTDNWVELTLRCIVRERGARALKDALSRDILAGLQANGLEIASGTYDITAFPPVKVELTSARPA